MRKAQTVDYGRRLEGHHVSVALADGSRIDDCVLVSAGIQSLWLYANGHDTFIRTGDVTDLWEIEPPCRSRLS